MGEVAVDGIGRRNDGVGGGNCRGVLGCQGVVDAWSFNQKREVMAVLRTGVMPRSNPSRHVYIRKYPNIAIYYSREKDTRGIQGNYTKDIMPASVRNTKPIAVYWTQTKN